VISTLAALSSPARAGAAPSDFVRLSDERTRTHSSVVLRSAWVRAAPSRRGRRMSRLGTATWHGSPEVVLLLGEGTVEGRRWSYIRYPGIGSRRGWVPADALSSTTLHTTRLVLDRARLRLKLLRGDRVLFRAPVGIGAPDSPTPAGRYYVRERLGPFASANSVYGVLAFGLSAFSPHRTDWPGGGQVGIHGTNQPSLIPGRISNGCVRVTNAKVRRLGRLLRIGVPLLIK
jgi:L,D-transpeptidase catalytic domain